MKIDEPVILVRISRLYRDNMSAEELYEASRGVWRVGPRREGAKYALAVHDGIVREVYAIADWHPAGTISYSTRKKDELPLEGRWEFDRSVAPPAIRQAGSGSVSENPTYQDVVPREGTIRLESREPLTNERIEGI